MTIIFAIFTSPITNKNEEECALITATSNESQIDHESASDPDVNDNDKLKSVMILLKHKSMVLYCKPRKILHTDEM